MALPRPLDRAGWVALARIRILNILRVRIAATIRQIEVKVCESGPPDRRPQPHIVANALQELIDTGTVRRIKPRGEAGGREETAFFTLRELYPNPAQARIDALLVHYRLHRMLTDREEYCSRVLEGIVRASFDAAGGYVHLGILPKRASLDATYRFGKYTVGIEVKNVREWVYPMSGRVWVMIRKCLELDAVPLLVTRKMAYLTHSVFARLGIMGFEYYRQVFSPLVAEYLTYIRHTDHLGYKDVIASDPSAANPALVVFAQRTLAGQLPVYRQRWEDHMDLLREFAIERNLGDPDMRDEERQEHYPEFARRLLYPEQERNDQEPDY